MSVVDVADQLGMHKNSARFHLDALVDAGYAERWAQPTGHQGRPPLLFSATDASPTLTNIHLLELTDVLFASFVAPAPDAAQRAAEAGRAWGASVARSDPDDGAASVDDLVGHLGQRGFTTVRDESSLTFTRCPFRTTVRPDILPLLCTMHKGFLDGYLEAGGTGVGAGPIDVGPLRCVCALNETESPEGTEFSQHPTTIDAPDKQR